MKYIMERCACMGRCVQCVHWYGNEMVNFWADNCSKLSNIYACAQWFGSLTKQNYWFIQFYGNFARLWNAFPPYSLSLSLSSVSIFFGSQKAVYFSVVLFRITVWHNVQVWNAIESALAASSTHEHIRRVHHYHQFINRQI